MTDVKRRGRPRKKEIAAVLPWQNAPAKPDMVNKPPHYTHSTIECIDAMCAAFGDEAVRTYCRIAAFKYQWRADHKGSPKQDLEKAVWYLRFAAGDDPRITHTTEE